MKKTILILCKCFAAAVISLIILSLISMVYYNPPIAIVQPDGITNFKYIPDTEWSFMWEGYGNGKTDNLGYNNAYHSDSSNPDIVFVGSSHLEGLQVPQEANCVYLLNELFDKDNYSDNNFKCLNLGMSGHFFEVSASNYQYIADEFKDAKYIVIEVFDAKYSPDVLDGMIEDKYHSPMEQRSMLREMFLKVPYIRLVYKKITETMPANGASVSAENNVNAPSDKESELSVYTEKMNIVLSEISKISSENNIVPIILMHERFYENNDGEIILETDAEYKKAFKECCETNNLKVVDVSSEMVAEYLATYNLSYGFSNSAPGEGHLNKIGHRIIAQTMYKTINEMEGLR